MLKLFSRKEKKPFCEQVGDLHYEFQRGKIGVTKPVCILCETIMEPAGLQGLGLTIHGWGFHCPKCGTGIRITSQDGVKLKGEDRQCLEGHNLFVTWLSQWRWRVRDFNNKTWTVWYEPINQDPLRYAYAQPCKNFCTCQPNVDQHYPYCVHLDAVHVAPWDTRHV